MEKLESRLALGDPVGPKLVISGMPESLKTSSPPAARALGGVFSGIPESSTLIGTPPS